MNDTRLKGDDTYPQCGYCHKPIRDDQGSTSIGTGGEQAPFHGKCFPKWCDEFPKRLAIQRSGGTKMQGQMVADPETGELVDEATLMSLYTDTGISGKALLTERCKLGEYVKITMIAQVRTVGEVMDDKGAKSHVQKLVVTSVEDVKRGAI